MVSKAGAVEGEKKSMLLRGWEMDGLRVDVVVEEEGVDEWWEDWWRVERARLRISWDFLVWLIARCGMEGAAEASVAAVETVVVGALLSALAK